MEKSKDRLVSASTLKIAMPVVNDLNFDQRMQRICDSLQSANYEPVLIGREMPDSLELKEHKHRQIRWKIPFRQGKLFYITYNLRLFWHYLFTDYDVFVANDLDTAPAGIAASILKNKPLVYDAHEYFPELPEVVERPITRTIWSAVEKMVMKRARSCYTVNQSIADIFYKKYGRRVEVVRNATVFKERQFPTKKEDKYILYQGAVNVGRGVEEMIRAMPLIKEELKLIVCGDGDVYGQCKALVTDLELERRVVFKGRVEPQRLEPITLNAFLGFTFFTEKGKSYYYSLANRFFDYMHNGVPQLAVNFPEYRHINQNFEVAVLVDELVPEKIAQHVNNLNDDKAQYDFLKSNCHKAALNYNWQNEERKLLGIYNQLR